MFILPVIEFILAKFVVGIVPNIIGIEEKICNA